MSLSQERPPVLLSQERPDCSARTEQQQLQQQVQRGQSAAVLIRLTLGTCRVGESPDLHSDRPSPWASWPARDEG